MHVVFEPSTQIDWERFFNGQVEQYGTGNVAAPYQGFNHQCGLGRGGIFTHLVSHLLPLVTKGASALAPELAKSGQNVMKDVLNGETLTNSVRKHGMEGVNKVLSKVTTPAPSQKALQSGSGACKRKPSTADRIEQFLSRVDSHSAERSGAPATPSTFTKPPAGKKRKVSKFIEKPTLTFM
ncbi:hypothetical protein QR680_003808 [Steinernema hermaphroditum]|uniref:Uncharacterized protein n=1 Tax=Steinernema hermaphroditum TaxID=289476 RepID=A0AA39HN08_9BILA|nr:hypothetical protein QR680_003808 [Steinernema hermaphroditum]